MKRIEIENKLSKLLSEFRERIQAYPLTAFLVGLGSGVIFTVFMRPLLFILVFLALLVWALWFFAEVEENEFSKNDSDGF